VLLGGTAGGFLGVLFALPVGAVVAVILREEVRKHRVPAHEPVLPPAESAA
jgi:predicted PurR-regulated permease PerM